MKRKDVGVGAEEGVVMGGRPVGRMPKSWGRGCVILGRKEERKARYTGSF